MIKIVLFLLCIMEQAMALTLTSPSFQDNTPIPKTYTCDGKNISPQLNWTDVPQGTKSFVLICDDPDAPMGTWVHWILFNIPANLGQLDEAITALPAGTLQGTTSFNKLGYGGPCPPSGTHHYFFKLYALDAPLSLNEAASKTDVEKAMSGHILGQTQLIGLYKRVP